MSNQALLNSFLKETKTINNFYQGESFVNPVLEIRFKVFLLSKVKKAYDLFTICYLVYYVFLIVEAAVSENRFSQSNKKLVLYFQLFIVISVILLYSIKKSLKSMFSYQKYLSMLLYFFIILSFHVECVKHLKEEDIIHDDFKNSNNFSQGLSEMFINEFRYEEGRKILFGSRGQSILNTSSFRNTIELMAYYCYFLKPSGMYLTLSLIQKAVAVGVYAYLGGLTDYRKVLLSELFIFCSGFFAYFVKNSNFNSSKNTFILQEQYNISNIYHTGFINEFNFPILSICSDSSVFANKKFSDIFIVNNIYESNYHDSEENEQNKIVIHETGNSKYSYKFLSIIFKKILQNLNYISFSFEKILFQLYKPLITHFHTLLPLHETLITVIPTKKKLVTRIKVFFLLLLFTSFPCSLLLLKTEVLSACSLSIQRFLFL